MTPTEAIPGHIIETVDATIGVPYDAIIQVFIDFVVTHHIKGHPHIGVLHLTQKTAADPNHALHISQVRKFHTSLHPILADLQQNLKIADILESQ